MFADFGIHFILLLVELFLGSEDFFVREKYHFRIVSLKRRRTTFASQLTKAIIQEMNIHATKLLINLPTKM